MMARSLLSALPLSSFWHIRFCFASWRLPELCNTQRPNLLPPPLPSPTLPSRPPSPTTPPTPSIPNTATRTAPAPQPRTAALTRNVLDGHPVLLRRQLLQPLHERREQLVVGVVGDHVAQRQARVAVAGQQRQVACEVVGRRGGWQVVLARWVW